MIIEAIVSEIQGSAAVTALAKRIYPDRIPQQNEPPAITYKLDADERHQVSDGPSAHKIALIELKAWAPEKLRAHQIAEAIETLLAPAAPTYPRQLGDVSAGITASHIRLERKFDIFENDTHYFAVSQQFHIAYTT